MALTHPCCSQSTKPTQSVKPSNTVWLQIRDYRAGFWMLSEDAVCGHMGTVAALLVVCTRNQRPPLLEWEADVSEEFSWLQQFFPFFMPKLWALPPSLPLSLALCCIYISTLFSLLLFSLWHILYLKLFLNQRGDSLLQSVSCKQRKFFFGSAVQQLDIETLHPSDVSGGGKEWERERCSCDRGSFSASLCGILVSCLTLRFATLTESLFWKAGGSSVGCSLCVCCCRWTLVLRHTLHGSERGMESSSNFIIQHFLPSHSPHTTECVRVSTLSFHSGHSLCGDVSCLDQTWHNSPLNPSIMTALSYALSLQETNVRISFHH